MCSWVCFNGSLNCAIPRENCHLHFPISSSHHRLQGLNVGESREMAWGQSGMARGDSSDAGSEGRDTLSCLQDTRFVKYVIRLRSNRLSVSNTIISRLSNKPLSRGHSIYEMGVINLRITFSWDTSTTCSCDKSSLSHIYPSKALGNMQVCVFEVISVSYDLFKLSTKLNVSVLNGPVVNQMVQWDLQKRCN